MFHQGRLGLSMPLGPAYPHHAILRELSFTAGSARSSCLRLGTKQIATLRGAAFGDATSRRQAAAANSLSKPEADSEQKAIAALDANLLDQRSAGYPAISELVFHNLQGDDVVGEDQMSPGYLHRFLGDASRGSSVFSSTRVRPRSRREPPLPIEAMPSSGSITRRHR